MPGKATRHPAGGAVHPFSDFTRRPPPSPASQSAAAIGEMRRCEKLARENGYLCRFRVQINTELAAWWEHSPPLYKDDVTIEVDPDMLPGRNLLHVEVYPMPDKDKR